MSIDKGLNSIDFMLSQAALYGVWPVLYMQTVAGTTTPTIASGGITAKRMPSTITIPTLGSGVTGVYFPHIRMNTDDPSTTCVAALEYLLITLRHVNITMTANAGTDTLTVTAHGCSNGDWVRFTTTTTLPAPLALNTDYYVIGATTNTFQVSLTSGGSAIDITDTGTGTHTCNYAVTPGVSMPTKTVMGVSAVAPTMMPMLVCTTAFTATTPTVTITYTDQDGNTGNSCVPVLPSTSAINTAYCLSSLLASGDTGIKSVQNITTSAGTVGTYKVYGTLPLGAAPISVASLVASPSPLSIPHIPYLGVGAENIGFYRFGATSSNDFWAVLVGVPDN